jgi:bifunctional oligoribonuclease and PAP phosphatase NrnA
MPTPTTSDAHARDRIRDEIRRRQRFVLSSHARPDGDSIGSQLAMAFALRDLGKEVTVVNRDPAPAPMLGFPGVGDIRIASAVEGSFDAAIIMECGSLERTGVTGLDRSFVINIDHHPGNTEYGALNWFDASAAACGELVLELIDALGVPLTREIATHAYLAIVTDTGSFHFSHITPRTFDMARRAVEAGVDPVAMARAIFDSNNLGRLKIFGAVLSAMDLHEANSVAVLYVDDEMLAQAGATYDDTEGLINLPLTTRDVQVVVFFKKSGVDEYRVSLRSKGAIDVGSVARQFGGGGHLNAAGFTLYGAYADVKPRVAAAVAAVVRQPAGAR